MNTQPQVTVESFIASGDKLWRRQRERLQLEEQAYLAERFRRLQEFEERARSLVNERDDSLRELELRWAQSRAEGERMLSALAHLREG